MKELGKLFPCDTQKCEDCVHFDSKNNVFTLYNFINVDKTIKNCSHD